MIDLEKEQLAAIHELLNALECLSPFLKDDNLVYKKLAKSICMSLQRVNIYFDRNYPEIRKKALDDRYRERGISRNT